MFKALTLNVIILVATISSNHFSMIHGQDDVVPLPPNDEDIPDPINPNCGVTIRDADRSPWYAGLDVGFDAPQIVLDFTDSGLNLQDIQINPGTNFDVSIVGQTIGLLNPGWVTSTMPGFIGFHGLNYGQLDALATFVEPICGDGPNSGVPPPPGGDEDGPGPAADDIDNDGGATRRRNLLRA